MAGSVTGLLRKTQSQPHKKLALRMFHGRNSSTFLVLLSSTSVHFLIRLNVDAIMRKKSSKASLCLEKGNRYDQEQKVSLFLSFSTHVSSEKQAEKKEKTA